MRYIDNPNLTTEELAVLREAVNHWRKAQSVPCRPGSARLNPSVESAHLIAETYPHLSSDLIPLTRSQNPLLAFFSYLTLVWIGSEAADSCREQLLARQFPVLDGCFLTHRSLESAVEAAKLHLRFYGRHEDRRD
jgi:hypothetical protein